MRGWMKRGPQPGAGSGSPRAPGLAPSPSASPRTAPALFNLADVSSSGNIASPSAPDSTSASQNYMQLLMRQREVLRSIGQASPEAAAAPAPDRPRAEVPVSASEGQERLSVLVRKSERPRVLMVVAQSLMGKANAVMLGKIGCVVETTRSGREAFQIWSANPSSWNLIIVERGVVDMSALEVASMIREQEQHGNLRGVKGKLHTPLVFLCGTGDNVAEHLQAGFDHFLHKPLSNHTKSLRFLLLPFSLAMLGEAKPQTASSNYDEMRRMLEEVADPTPEGPPTPSSPAALSPVSSPLHSPRFDLLRQRTHVFEPETAGGETEGQAASRVDAQVQLRRLRLDLTKALAQQKDLQLQNAALQAAQRAERSRIASAPALDGEERVQMGLMRDQVRELATRVGELERDLLNAENALRRRSDALSQLRVLMTAGTVERSARQHKGQSMKELRAQHDELVLDFQLLRHENAQLVEDMTTLSQQKVLGGQEISSKLERILAQATEGSGALRSNFEERIKFFRAQLERKKTDWLDMNRRQQQLRKRCERAEQTSMQLDRTCRRLECARMELEDWQPSDEPDLAGPAATSPGAGASDRRALDRLQATCCSGKLPLALDWFSRLFSVVSRLVTGSRSAAEQALQKHKEETRKAKAPIAQWVAKSLDNSMTSLPQSIAKNAQQCLTQLDKILAQVITAESDRAVREYQTQQLELQRTRRVRLEQCELQSFTPAPILRERKGGVQVVEAGAGTNDAGDLVEIVTLQIKHETLGCLMLRACGVGITLEDFPEDGIAAMIAGAVRCRLIPDPRFYPDWQKPKRRTNRGAKAKAALQAIGNRKQKLAIKKDQTAEHLQRLQKHADEGITTDKTAVLSMMDEDISDLESRLALHKSQAPQSTPAAANHAGVAEPDASFGSSMAEDLEKWQKELRIDRETLDDTDDMKVVVQFLERRQERIQLEMDRLAKQEKRVSAASEYERTQTDDDLGSVSHGMPQSLPMSYGAAERCTVLSLRSPLRSGSMSPVSPTRSVFDDPTGSPWGRRLESAYGQLHKQLVRLGRSLRIRYGGKATGDPHFGGSEGDVVGSMLFQAGLFKHFAEALARHDKDVRSRNQRFVRRLSRHVMLEQVRAKILQGEHTPDMRRALLADVAASRQREEARLGIPPVEDGDPFSRLLQPRSSWDDLRQVSRRFTAGDIDTYQREGSYCSRGSAAESEATDSAEGDLGRTVPGASYTSTAPHSVALQLSGSGEGAIVEVATEQGGTVAVRIGDRSEAQGAVLGFLPSSNMVAIRRAGGQWERRPACEVAQAIVAALNRIPPDHGPRSPNPSPLHSPRPDPGSATPRILAAGTPDGMLTLRPPGAYDRQGGARPVSPHPPPKRPRVAAQSLAKRRSLLVEQLRQVHRELQDACYVEDRERLGRRMRVLCDMEKVLLAEAAATSPSPGRAPAGRPQEHRPQDSVPGSAPRARRPGPRPRRRPLYAVPERHGDRGGRLQPRRCAPLPTEAVPRAPLPPQPRREPVGGWTWREVLDSKQGQQLLDAAARGAAPSKQASLDPRLRALVSLLWNHCAEEIQNAAALEGVVGQSAAAEQAVAEAARVDSRPGTRQQPRGQSDSRAADLAAQRVAAAAQRREEALRKEHAAELSELERRWRARFGQLLGRYRDSENRARGSSAMSAALSTGFLGSMPTPSPPQSRLCTPAQPVRPPTRQNLPARPGGPTEQGALLPLLASGSCTAAEQGQEPEHLGADGSMRKRPGMPDPRAARAHFVEPPSGCLLATVAPVADDLAEPEVSVRSVAAVVARGRPSRDPQSAPGGQALPIIG